MLITVLLNEACTLQIANGTFFFSFFRPGAFLGAGAPSSAPAARGAVSLAGPAPFAGGAASFASAFFAGRAAFSGFSASSFALASFGPFVSAMNLPGPQPKP